MARKKKLAFSQGGSRLPWTPQNKVSPGAAASLNPPGRLFVIFELFYVFVCFGFFFWALGGSPSF